MISENAGAWPDHHTHKAMTWQDNTGVRFTFTLKVICARKFRKVVLEILITIGLPGHILSESSFFSLFLSLSLTYLHNQYIIFTDSWSLANKNLQFKVQFLTTTHSIYSVPFKTFSFDTSTSHLLESNNMPYALWAVEFLHAKTNIASGSRYMLWEVVCFCILCDSEVSMGYFCLHMEESIIQINAVSILEVNISQAA